MATLLARWKVTAGQDSGTTWVEPTGGHDGTLVNMAAGSGWFPTSRPGADGEMVFDGTNDRVDVGTSSVFALSRDFTLAAWVNISTSGVGGSQAILSRNVGGFYLRTAADKINFLSSNTANVLTAGTTITRGVWNHVAATVSAAGLVTLYLNGVADGSTTTAVTFTGSALAIGADNGTDNWLGSMDDIRIYDGALTGAEVLALMDGDPDPPGGLPGPIASHYHRRMRAG